MFKYEDGGQSKPREKQIKRIAQVRKVTYINPNPDKKKKDEPIITEGYEIVKEVVLSPKDYELMAGLPPEVVDRKTVEFVPKITRKKKQTLQEKEDGSN